MNYKGIKDKIYICKNCGVKFKDRGHCDRGNYCSKKCHGESRTKAAFEKYRIKFEKGLLKDEIDDRRWIYRVLVEKDGNVCNVCGMNGEWQDKPLRLIVNHINGDSRNSKPSNLELICPNCESQSPFFKSRNIGNGRKRRRKHS